MSPAPSRLRGLAQRPARQPVQLEEQCELCSEAIPPGHRHLLDLHDRRLLCSCRPCSILFDARAAGGGHYRLIPDRSRYLAGFELDDALWQGFRIPVDLAFFFHSSAAGRVVAFYPSPLGATESLLDLGDWEELVVRNPVLERLETDVEALLVNRAVRSLDTASGTPAAGEYWIVPVDRCYALVGVIRTRWKGFGGGPDVWEDVASFFEGLRRGAKIVGNDGKETTWRT